MSGPNGPSAYGAIKSKKINPKEGVVDRRETTWPRRGRETMKCKDCGTTEEERFVPKYSKSRCKDCKNEYQRQWRLANPDYKKRWRENHPDADRTWRESEHGQEYRRALQRKLYAKNPARYLDRTHRRRKYYTEGTMPADWWEQLLDWYGPVCLKCGSEEQLTLDHVVPLSLGGKHELANAQILCRSCNCSKGNRSCEDYRTGELLE